MNSSVGLLRCNSYDEKDVNETVKAITRPFKEENKDVLKGKSVVIYFDFPAPNAKVVKATIDFLRESGVSKITAGAFLFTKNEEFNELKTVFNEAGIEFIDFSKGQFEKLTTPLIKEKMPEHFRGYALLSPVQYTREKQYDKMGVKGKRMLKYSFLPVALTDSDYIVPILKLKTSPVTGLGGVVSSVFGLIPTITRNRILVSKVNYQMERALLEAYALLKDRILFVLIDGIRADISDDEEINKMNVIIFGEDGLAVDSVSSVLIGYRSRDIKTNKIGDDIMLGNGLFSHVSIYGDDFLEFRKEAKKYLKFKPNVKSFPEIAVQDKNTLMRIEQFCPTGAIKIENGQYAIDRKSCIRCMFCVQIAPDIFKL